jgi:lysophospholipase L1-like esterase
MYFDVGSGGGSFTWKIGTGSTTTVTGAQTGVDVLTSSIPVSGGQVLTIAWASGIVALDGIVHYAGDEASGARFHACGHYGWNISATSPDGWFQPETFTLDWLQAFGAFPDLGAIIICLGANDQGAWTGPQFEANYLAGVAAIRAEGRLPAGIPVIPVIQYACGITPVDPGGWPAYARAIRGAAAATANTSVIDVNYRMPPVSSGFESGELWLNGDTVGHPSNIGHALFGEIVAAGLAIA